MLTIFRIAIVTGASLLLVTSLGAAQPRKSGSAVATTSNYCRTSSVKRVIVATSAADMITAAGRNHEVVLDLAPVSGYPISILAGDRMTITALKDDRILLRHNREDPLTGQYFAIATAKLAPDSSGLWFRGPAVLESSGAEVGEYFAYRLPDSGPAGIRRCMHSKRPAGQQCRSLHFEYFDNLDSGSYGEKPKIGSNVEVMNATDSCKDGHAQTGEGDGDEGPDK